MNFVFDLDGTICFGGRPVSAAINDALDHIRELGHTLIFASARPIRDMLPVIDERFHLCPMIGGNGSLIAIDGQITYRHGFSKETRSRLEELIDRYDATYLIDGDWDYAYTGPADHPILNYVDGGGLAKQVDLSSLDVVMKILILSAHDIEQLAARLRELDVVLRVYRDMDGLDIVPSGVSKWSALRQLGVEEGSYIAFGNDANDIEMFQHARYTVMVGDHEQLAPLARERLSEDESLERKLVQSICGLAERAATL